MVVVEHQNLWLAVGAQALAVVGGPARSGRSEFHLREGGVRFRSSSSAKTIPKDGTLTFDRCLNGSAGWLVVQAAWAQDSADGLTRIYGGLGDCTSRPRVHPECVELRDDFESEAVFPIKNRQEAEASTAGRSSNGPVKQHTCRYRGCLA